MGKETEYKLEVGDLQLLDCILCSEPVASRMQAPFAYIRMQTTYYDTEDGLLEKNRWMLRLRTENERSVVTMKTPGEGHTRGEWEVEREYLDEALPVCGAKFTRITAPLRLSEQTTCTLCGDLGELTGGGKKALLCELELELQAGEEADVQEFAKTLAERFHLHEQPRSKLQRARALTRE